MTKINIIILEKKKYKIKQKIIQTFCYGLSWVPENSCVEVLSTSTSECELIWK